MSGSSRRTSHAAAHEHLSAVDPVMAALAGRFGQLDRPGEGRDTDAGDHYGALVRAIAGQQLSVAAARTIYTRLRDYFGGATPTPQQLLAADPDEMRVAAGLSRAKTSYLRSLAEHVESGELELDLMENLPDEAVIAELTAVKGIGLWTAHMFLLFHLDRPDVLATGDLGVRTAARDAYGLAELPSPGELDALADGWAPHRSSACRYLWQSLNVPSDF